MKQFSVCLILTLFSLHPVRAQYFITTIAGALANPGYTGDGGPALNAKLFRPTGLATDRAGNLYIADMSNAVVRKIDPSGIISTVAGTGSAGNSGDNGPATSAQMGQPAAVCVDNAGNLYIADYRNNVIRKVNTSGIITTIAGNGTNGYSGDGGTATAAQISLPLGIAVDGPGNIYFTEGGNDLVRKVTPAGIISTFAGTGTPGYSGDGGPAAAALFGGVQGIAIDGANNVYIADDIYFVIRRVNTSGMISTFAGNGTAGYSGDGGPATAAQFQNSSPVGIAIDKNNNLFVTDYQNFVVREINTSGIINTIAGTGAQGYSGDGGAASAATLRFPQGIAVDQTGNIFITDAFDNTIRKIFDCQTVTLNLDPASTSVCSGESAVFAVSANNATSYLWQVNSGSGWTPLSDGGYYSGSATATLTISNPAPALNDYQYRCMVTGSCNTVISGLGVLAVTPAVTPAISITATASRVCADSTVVFTADPVNGGSAPVYQWTVNGSAAGNNSPVFTSAGLSTGDVVQCLMSSSATCSTAPSATSNSIVVTVIPTTPLSISISTSTPAVCQGAAVTFEATPTDGGGTPQYQWQVNGAPAGADSSTFTTSTLTNGDVVSCTLTTNLACSPPATSTTIPVVIYPVPIVTAGPDTVLAPGAPVQLYASSDSPVASYQWTPAEGLSNSGTADPIATPQNSITYRVTATSAQGCQGYADAKISLIQTLNMPNAFTPNGDGHNDLFRIPPGTPLDLQDFSVYDRWGALVFRTSDINLGWDGNLRGTPANAGTYIYRVTGAVQGKPVLVKGTVILVR
jgi:gliding motility-associated-like protein